MHCSFLQNSLKFIERNELIARGESVLVAVSGGGDSVAMLLFFYHFLRPRFKLTLLVAHLNHGLRGKAADRDQDFVEALSKKLGISFFEVTRNFLI